MQINEEKRSRQTADEKNDFIITEILKKLSDCNSEASAEYIRRLKDLGIPTDLGYRGTIRIVADQYYHQFSQEAQYVRVLTEIYNKVLMLRPALPDNEIQVIGCMENGRILLLVFSSREEEIRTYSHNLFDELNAAMTDQTVSLGISDIYRNDEDITRAFAESEKAVMGRFYLGQKQFIEYSMVRGRNVELQYDTEPVVKELTHAVTICDYMAGKEIIEKVFLDLSYCMEDAFRHYMHEIIDGLSARVESFSSFVTASSTEIDFYVDYLNTYRELKAYMSSLLKKSIEYISLEKEKKSERRIEMAKDYIALHYGEPFTLNDIADYVELNPSYFSNLFKTETGVNFSEYLLNVRMDKAKELLKDPKTKIYEIGNLVGYEDAVSFGRAFKKKWGISPKEYRNSVY